MRGAPGDGRPYRDVLLGILEEGGRSSALHGPLVRASDALLSPIGFELATGAAALPAAPGTWTAIRAYARARRALGRAEA